jgi:hypothetical protein
MTLSRGSTTLARHALPDLARIDDFANLHGHFTFDRSILLIINCTSRKAMAAGE